MGTDILNQSANEWYLSPTVTLGGAAAARTNNPFGSQSNFSSMPGALHQQPGFQATTARPLSSNPFEQTPSHHLTPAGLMSAYNSRKTDDSFMVDNLFAAMGTADSGGDDFLSALNSVLMGVSTMWQQQNNNWDYQIPGWGEEEVGSQHSRLGDYRD
jgi:hypothetical protein